MKDEKIMVCFSSTCSATAVSPGYYVLGVFALVIIVVLFGRYKNFKLYRYIRDGFNVGWDALARLGRTKIMQLTIITPILGYFILFNDYIRQNYTVFGCFPLWKISFLYFGLIFLSVASIVYSFACPKIVRLYETPAEYVAHNLDFTFKHRLQFLIKKIFGRYKPYGKAWVFSKLEIPYHVTVLIGMMRDSDEADNNARQYQIEVEKMEERIRGDEYAERKFPTRRELLYADYMLSVDDNYSARLVVFIMYSVGFALVSIPTVFMVLEVIYEVIWITQ